MIRCKCVSWLWCFSLILGSAGSLFASIGDLTWDDVALVPSGLGGDVVLDRALGISAPVELGGHDPGIAPYAPGVDAWDAPPSVSQNIEVVPPGPIFGFFGDINMDGVTDMSDLAILQVNFGKSPATKSDGDLNGDGVVDNADFAILQANFQNAIIPEPSSLLIWGGLLLVGGAIYVRRRRPKDPPVTREALSLPAAAGDMPR